MVPRSCAQASRTTGRHRLVVGLAGSAASGCALGARRGVEADRGGGGEVEALGAAVDRDPDPVVGQRGELVGQPPRLVAEQPGGRPGQQPVVAASSRSSSPAPSAARTVQPGRLRGADGAPPGRGSSASGRWNSAADRGPDRLGVVGVDRVRRPAPPRRRRRRRRSGSRCRRCRGRGRRRRPRPAGPARRSSTSASGCVEEAADRDDALRGDAVAERGQRARRRRACHGAARPRRSAAYCSAAAGVANTSTHAAGDARAPLDGLRALGEEQPPLGPDRAAAEPACRP